MGTVSAFKITKKRKEPAVELHGELDVVRSYAAQVTSEDHWKQILASAPSDQVRAELERTVGPLLSFRRAAPCHTPECDSMLPAEYQPVLICYVTMGDAPLWAPLELRYCAKCKDDIRVGDVLTDGVWEQILKQCLEAGDNPRRFLTQLSWDRVH
jgi:hypothetical protein